MDAQTQADKPGFLVRQERQVQSCWNQRVEGVKADTATFRRVDWLSQDMVDINQYPRHQQQKRRLPSFTETRDRHEQRNQDV